MLYVKFKNQYYLRIEFPCFFLPLTLKGKKKDC